MWFALFTAGNHCPLPLARWLWDRPSRSSACLKQDCSLGTGFGNVPSSFPSKIFCVDIYLGNSNKVIQDICSRIALGGKVERGIAGTVSSIDSCTGSDEVFDITSRTSFCRIENGSDVDWRTRECVEQDTPRIRMGNIQGYLSRIVSCEIIGSLGKGCQNICIVCSGILSLHT